MAVNLSPGWSDLPAEKVEEIIEKLSPGELVAFRSTEKRVYALCNEKLLNFATKLSFVSENCKSLYDEGISVNADVVRIINAEIIQLYKELDVEVSPPVGLNGQELTIWHIKNTGSLLKRLDIESNREFFHAFYRCS